MDVKHMLPGKVLMVDKTAWDWTVPEWLINQLCRLIDDLNVDSCPLWRFLHWKRFGQLFYQPVFQFSDGTQVSQPQPGVMKSGCYLTLLGNSLMQQILHATLSRSPLPIAIGDDTAQEVPEELDAYLRRMSELGFKLKPKLGDEVVEFAGVLISKRGFTPAYEEKHKFLLRHLDDEVAVETLLSYQQFYSFGESEMLGRIRAIAREFGPEALVSWPDLKSISRG